METMAETDPDDTTNPDDTARDPVDPDTTARNPADPARDCRTEASGGLAAGAAVIAGGMLVAFAGVVLAFFPDGVVAGVGLALLFVGALGAAAGIWTLGRGVGR